MAFEYLLVIHDFFKMVNGLQDMGIIEGGMAVPKVEVKVGPKKNSRRRGKGHFNSVKYFIQRSMICFTISNPLRTISNTLQFHTDALTC